MQRLTHVALTVPRELFAPGPRGELVAFYAEVFGWSESPGLEIPGERIVLRAPTDLQYVTLRAADAPMATRGSEHLGIAVDSEAELREVHRRASAFAERAPDVGVSPLAVKYGGKLMTFRVRFRLPLAIEVQWLAELEPPRAE